LWDIDGNEYIDYHAAFAAYILGHGDPIQANAIRTSLESGASNYGSGPTVEEAELAKLFLRCVPAADKVQFFNTGSEATAQAIRVARAATGRDHVILMQGGYNGNQNVVAANLMNTAEQLGGRQVVGDEYPLIPMTAGIPLAERQLLHAIEFNDLEAVRNVAKRYNVAALITEPVLQNIGIVKPRPGYLEGLRKLADELGFVLIFDEVKTGFRAGLGGYQGLSGVTPDLSTFGKAIANGFPIAALAGKRSLMDLAVSDDPLRRVLVAGTYNCHPVAMAATKATLEILLNPTFDVTYMAGWRCWPNGSKKDSAGCSATFESRRRSAGSAARTACTSWNGCPTTGGSSSPATTSRSTLATGEHSSNAESITSRCL
jgi:glutamate-1-semialdehyde 2,1-aminomutase